MSPDDRVLAARFDTLLQAFDLQHRRLPGIAADARRACFVAQLVESDRRIRHVRTIRARPLSALRGDPTTPLFDPIKAAILHLNSGDPDEAGWLVFLSVHFGKALKSGWALSREVYGGANAVAWTWARTSANPTAFRSWLGRNAARLKRAGYRFGNHRKYQSLDARKPRGTGDAIESYVHWVSPARGHRGLFDDALARHHGDAGRAFDHLYRSMVGVSSFGRMARFDYLTMIGKIGIAAIEPASTYMDGATGPLAGAQRLFGVRLSRRLRRSDIDGRVIELGAHLNVGMQVMEDAICNWQKSPARFKRFRG